MPSLPPPRHSRVPRRLPEVAPAGARGRAPSGTVHRLTAAWLPTCGAGINGWDRRALHLTTAAVTCRRCLGLEAPPPETGQGELFSRQELKDLARRRPSCS